MANSLRNIPAMHELQKTDDFKNLLATGDFSRRVLTEIVSSVVNELRRNIVQETIDVNNWSKEDFTTRIFLQVEWSMTHILHPNIEKVINGTGVVLHTNLGRARLSKRAQESIRHVSEHYSTVEYDAETGKRGLRNDIVESYLQQLTCAEAAIVVNNNAAAVYFILKAFAEQKEVIVSRGELVEIGGSFRVSEIMEESNVKLVEVGTTNKTYITDYERAITEETSLLLKVHKSNFSIVGFTDDVVTEELVALSERKNVPVYEDLGSGTLYPFAKEKIGQEEPVVKKVQQGIDLISFSGDKLLGGPQAGIIVGKKKYIDVLKNHQLARVLRVDKFTLASLEATLHAYVKGTEKEDIPTVRDILADKETIYERARMCMQRVAGEQSLTCTIEEGTSKVGGGTMPEVELPTYVLKVAHTTKTALIIERELRDFHVPIIVRLTDHSALIDFRTITDEEVSIVSEALLHLARH